MDLKNKNIVLLIKTPVLGGAERQALGFAKYAISKYQAHVTLIATHSASCSKEFKTFANEIGIDKVHYFGKYAIKLDKTVSLRNFKNLIKTSRYLVIMAMKIRKMNPYLIVPFLNPPSKLAVLIYKFTGAKYTFWHQLGLDYFTKDIIEQLAIRKTPLFIANAENGLDEITNSYDVPKEKLFCLPQQTTLTYEKKDANRIKESLNINKNSIVIGMISHYREEKLFDLLLESFVVLSQKYDIHLVFLGDATNSIDTRKKYNYFVEKVQKLDCKNKISILSEYQVSKILNILDIGVLVSTIEGTPNVVMEYMLYGLPVVATKHAGCQELLVDKEMLIENKSEELCEKLKLLVENENERIRIGNNNKITIREYSEENYFEKFTQIFS
jgi:glycosyltransferase involved in cell wall biosynthesis